MDQPRAGERLLELVAVMDRLRSLGGCPWDAEQTHESLARYLLEEAYEAVDAIESGDAEALREELGDVLLQVVFHARVAQEAPPGQRWTIDDVAAGIVDKLVRRHPHVFGDVQAPTAEHVAANWEVLKAAEKGRTSSTAGIPLGQPALALAAQLVGRAAKAGVDAPVETPISPPATVDTESVGELLLAVVALARGEGIDPEGALRAAARRYRQQVIDAESTASE